MLWQGRVAGRAAESSVSEDDELILILVVPDGGSQLLALGGGTGLELATVRLAANQGKLVGMPLITPDGRIVIARQKYSESEASLMVYELQGLPSVDADAAQNNTEEELRYEGPTDNAEVSAAVSER